MLQSDVNAVYAIIVVVGVGIVVIGFVVVQANSHTLPSIRAACSRLLKTQWRSTLRHVSIYDENPNPSDWSRCCAHANSHSPPSV
jgi:ABC-type lipoprotein release transport system permease subunit